jgi:hypothetical protein
MLLITVPIILDQAVGERSGDFRIGCWFLFPFFGSSCWLLFPLFWIQNNGNSYQQLETK